MGLRRSVAGAPTLQPMRGVSGTPARSPVAGLRKYSTIGTNRRRPEDDCPMDEEVFAFGSFRLNPAQRMLSEDGTPVRLGGRALDILAALT